MMCLNLFSRYKCSSFFPHNKMIMPPIQTDLVDSSVVTPIELIL